MLPIATGGTTVALTLGSAAITGFVAYVVARTHAGIATTQANAEAERLRMDHGEAARRSREQAYHAFITLLYRLDVLVAGFAPTPFDDDAFHRWLDEFHQLYGGIDLFGAASVRMALPGVRNAIDEVGLAAAEKSDGSFVERFTGCYRRGRPALESSMETLIQAMRADVGSSTLAAAPLHQR